MMVGPWRIRSIRSCRRKVGLRRRHPAPRLGEDEELIRTHRSGEGIALQDMAAEAAQQLCMGQRFDAFRDCFDVADLADVDDRTDEALLRGGFEQRLNKPAVDLQPCRRQLKQADDGSMAGAEIVDLDLDAEGFDVVDGLFEPVVERIEGDRFQEFEGERFRGDVQRAQRMGELRIVQPLGGYIGRDLADAAHVASRGEGNEGRLDISRLLSIHRRLHLPTDCKLRPV